MVKTTVEIDGMMCGMCESHVSEALRNALKVKKVSASHAKGKAEIISEEEITEEAVRKALASSGYEVLSVKGEPYEKKGFFSFMKSK